MAVIACSLALFVISFLFAIIYDNGSEVSLASAEPSMFDLQAPQALDAGNTNVSMNGHSMGSAVASLNPSFMEPLRFNVGPIHSYPHYLLVVSILGLIGTMLVMSWLSRTKA